MDASHQSSRKSPGAVALRVLVVLLALLAFYLLFEIVMIVLGAVIVALLLHIGAEPWRRWAKLPLWLSLVLSGLVIAALVGVSAYLFGARVSAEMQDLVQRISSAQDSITLSLQNSRLGRFALSHMGAGEISLPGVASTIISSGASVAEALIVTVIAGAYLAAQPELYRRGLVALFPAALRQRADETLEHLGRGLKFWLLGQLIQMLIIGVASGVAVWLIGLPAPFALGLIAGVTEFVPYLGPFIAAAPALLIAFGQSPYAMLWTALAYLAIHQIEGDVIAPLVQQRMVYVPPAVMLLGIVTVGVLFGTVAIIFAAPITVIAFVLVTKLYVRDQLGEETLVPGETSPE